MATATSGDSEEQYTPRTQQSPLASERAKFGQGPSETSRRGRIGSYFTLGYKEAVSQWWENVPAAVAEHNVMSFVPFLKAPPTQTQTGATAPHTSTSSGESTPTTSTPSLERTKSETAQTNDDPYGPRQWQSNLVTLSGKNRALNEFSVERIGEQVDENLVMLHGYGAGLGFFYKNFEGLSRAPGWKVYALDLLGMGRSTRPPFKIHAKDRKESVTEAENWFIDALEEWRIKRGLERFTLLGHSLGGYMAVAYALKYPGHLNKLILASPVGIPEDPYAMNAEMPGTTSLGNEFTQDQDSTTESSNPNIPEDAKVGTRGDKNGLFNQEADAAREARRTAALRGEVSGSSSVNTPEAPRKPLPKWLTYLWDANISPFSIVRWTGPLGPRFVSGWTSRRFSHLPPEEAQALHTYAYTLFKQRGSGEYALAYILAPGAFARSPLIRRIAGVGRQIIAPDGSKTSSVEVAAEGYKRESAYPVVLMYGENDWMDVAGGHDAVKVMNEEKKKVLADATAEERAKDNGDAKVVIIKKAGHHVYLDGWEQFNEVMLKEMAETRAKEKTNKI
jgi:cardiolipin-specific phospholipase